MGRAGSRLAILFSVGTLAVVGAAAAPAGADIVSPAAACVGSGMWQGGGISETSTAHTPADVIVVPRTDTVAWAGNQKGYALGAEGPRRDISGAVQLQLPLGTATIDTWSGSSIRYANEGQHTYDLPSVLAGIKMKLRGFHAENGAQVCGGSVYVKIAGSGPLKPIGLAGLVLSGGLLLFAGKPVFRKSKAAFEDVNEG